MLSGRLFTSFYVVVCGIPCVRDAFRSFVRMASPQAAGVRSATWTLET